MANIFELVVNFDRNAESVERAQAVCDEAASLRLGSIELPLRTSITSFAGEDGYIEFSVGCGIQHGGVRPPPEVNASELTTDELVAIAQQFYDLLRRFEGYVIAAVGWDPEEIVNPGELRSRLSESGLDRLDGFVLSGAIAAKLDVKPSLQPFSIGFVWLPFRDLRAA